MFRPKKFIQLKEKNIYLIIKKRKSKYYKNKIQSN